jgi:SAM-dependent methyltransferase
MTAKAVPRRAADPRIRLFDRIAWFYGLLFPVQRRVFRRAFGRIAGRLALPASARVLDIGCGTGAWLSVLAQMGFQAQAVDASPRMVETARRLLRGLRPPVGAGRVRVGDALAGLDFPDRSFDLVLAAHVIHGVPPLERSRFYREAGRLSRGLVLLHDYSPRPARHPGFVARVLEALERSDYRHFRRSGLRELRRAFAEVEVIAAAPGSAWYVCRFPGTRRGKNIGTRA